MSQLDHSLLKNLYQVTYIVHLEYKTFTHTLLIETKTTSNNIEVEKYSTKHLTEQIFLNAWTIFDLYLTWFFFAEAGRLRGKMHSHFRQIDWIEMKNSY